MLFDILKACAATEEYESLLRSIERGEAIHVSGAVGSLPMILVADIFLKMQRTILCVSSNDDDAQNLADDLAQQIHINNLSIFPAGRETPLGGRDRHSVSQQVETLERLVLGKPLVISSSIDGLSAQLLPAASMKRDRLDLKKSATFGYDELIGRLTELGLERQPMVEAPGDFSVRGGIIDLYPFSRPNPIRIEFYGQEIDSLREFDPQTQRSLRDLIEVVVFHQHPEMDSSERNSSTLTTLLSYLPQDMVVCFFQLEKLLSTIDDAERNDGRDDVEWLEQQNDESGNHRSTSPAWHQFESQFAAKGKIYFRQFSSPQSENSIKILSQPQPPLAGSLIQLGKDMENFLRSSPEARIYFLCESSAHAESMQDLLEESKIRFDQLHVIAGNLAGGFQWSNARLAVYTDHEFYGRIRRQRRSRRFSEGLSRRQLRSLSRGDFVVHIDHGVGIYQGLERIRVRGHERECLAIAYQEQDKLFVPIEKMDRVQKYSAREGFVPHINKLGSAEWERTKQRTSSKLKNIAKDLVALYAARQSQAGIAFSADSHWQREMEAAFPYEDTPDQRRAVTEVKADMEKARPMDRLICGDVGYGKTEVAIRAAFKAVQDGKQVAMLVPTTILAQQHYNTFRERLRIYPLQIELLSRFRSRAEQKATAKKLKEGSVDIVIGTHRLLSKDVAFKDLGLLIVDEEQLFGVRSKERLKQFRVNVDVLTLSATPIPRTLHMSLLNLRDMSQINTPPRDRLPIATEVVEFDRELIKHAILREVQRGGQVFFVHNRVQSIDRVAEMLEQLIPGVRFGVGHGQMHEHDLEKVMLDFLERRFEVLISTMIIESGLDLPNVNTIIVNRADRFGLSQLYQLRGRVGRSSQKAFCYLVIPPIKNLTPDALKRLQTIEEFTDLGSGFQIAMRDLEIRGAGSLLGAEQSGFIDSLGFDLYCKILEEAVNEVRREENLLATAVEEKLPECRVDYEGDAYLPDDFVEIPAERVNIYRRLAEAKTVDDVNRIRDELRDRFGRLPDATAGLMAMVKLRLLGSRAGLRSLHISDKLMVGYFADESTNGRGEQFNKWLGSMVRHATAPFEFLQDRGIGFRLEFSDRGVALALAEDFLLSLMTARIEARSTAMEAVA
jgi:transcription-repair coupling factor (superfamily II helicase)